MCSVSFPGLKERERREGRERKTETEEDKARKEKEREGKKEKRQTEGEREGSQKEQHFALSLKSVKIACPELNADEVREISRFKKFLRFLLVEQFLFHGAAMLQNSTM